jgi:phasin family protein
MKTQQFNELQQKNLETYTKLAQISFDNAQRLMTLQMEITRKLFEDGLANTKAQTASKDPQQALNLQSQYAQESTQTIMDATRQLAELCNASFGECAHFLTEQYASGNKDMASSLQSLFGAMPGQNTSLVENMTQAMSTVTNAFEQFAKATTAGLAPEAKTTAGKRRQA